MEIFRDLVEKATKGTFSPKSGQSMNGNINIKSYKEPLGVSIRTFYVLKILLRASTLVLSRRWSHIAPCDFKRT